MQPGSISNYQFRPSYASMAERQGFTGNRQDYYIQNNYGGNRKGQYWSGTWDNCAGTQQRKIFMADDKYDLASYHHCHHSGPIMPGWFMNTMLGLQVFGGLAEMFKPESS